MVIFKKVILHILFITIGILATPSFVHAQSKLTVIPPKFELFSNPGERVSEVIRVRNESSEVIGYTINVEDFSTSGEEGQVVLAEDENNTSYSLANWIETSQKDIILQPQEEAVIPFFINIPKNAEPGGHYASVLFESVAGEIEGAGAAVSNRIGTLVLMRVSGNVIEKAVKETFTAPSYSETGPIPITLRLKNEGNTHIIPQGRIIITNLFGAKVDELPLSGKNVLPGATRKMDTVWDKQNLLGVYNATLISTYGQQDQSITGTTRFTVMPTWAIVVGIILLFILVGTIVMLIFGRKRLSKMLNVMFKG